MNLDKAILNSLKKNAMEGAMQNVMATMGPSFEIHAVAQNAETVKQTVSQKVSVMDNSPLSRPVVSNSHPNMTPPNSNKPVFEAPKGMDGAINLKGKGLDPAFRRTF